MSNYRTILKNIKNKKHLITKIKDNFYKRVERFSITLKDYVGIIALLLGMRIPMGVLKK